MAEGTTLHNLLAKQMDEGSIGKTEARARKVINNNIKTGIASEASSNPTVKTYGKNLLKSESDMSDTYIKAARNYDKSK